MAALNLLCLPHSHPMMLEMPKYPLQKSFRHRNQYLTWRVTCSVSNQNSDPTTTSKRRSANYQPTSWSHNFLQSLDNIYSDVMYKDKAKKLEEEVRHWINNEDVELLSKLEMIDDIQRLGLGHRFEEDIKNNLHRIFSSEGSTDLKAVLHHQNSLHATALSFRLLRQHGYETSPDART